MALRAEEEERSNSPQPGLSYSWEETGKPPNYDWEQWVQLFEAAALATQFKSGSPRGKFEGNTCNKKDGESLVHINWESWPKKVDG